MLLFANHLDYQILVVSFWLLVFVFYRRLCHLAILSHFCARIYLFSVSFVFSVVFVAVWLIVLGFDSFPSKLPIVPSIFYSESMNQLLLLLLLLMVLLHYYHSFHYLYSLSHLKYAFLNHVSCLSLTSVYVLVPFAFLLLLVSFFFLAFVSLYVFSFVFFVYFYSID